MEILELLVASFDLCGCLLEIAAVSVDLSAWFTTRNYAQARRRARHGEAPPPERRWLLLAVVLAVIGVVLTAAVIAKWLSRRTGSQ